MFRWMSLAVVVCTIATSTRNGETQTPQGPINRIELPGISVLPPSGQGWIRRSAPERGILIIFSKLKHADQGIEKVHSFVLMANSWFADLPYDDAERLRSSLQEHLRREVRPELLKSLEVSPDTLETIARAPPPATAVVATKALCIRYRMRNLDEDRLSPEKSGLLTIEVHGKLCLHPYHPAYVTNLAYSQRSRDGDWDAAFDDEAEHFLKSAAFEPVPLSDYVSKRFNEYASLLSKLGRDEEASKIKQFAGRLVKPTSESSGNLGFDAKKVLQDYAELLRDQHEDASARRMQILGDAWQFNNVAAFIYQLQKRQPAIRKN